MIVMYCLCVNGMWFSEVICNACFFLRDVIVFLCVYGMWFSESAEATVIVM